MENKIFDEAPLVKLDKPEFTVDKITRSCERSISVNYRTYKVGTVLSATITDGSSDMNKVEAIGKQLYAQAESLTLDEINKIREVLNRGN